MSDIVIGILANIVRTYAIYRFMNIFFEQKENKRLLFCIYALNVIMTSGGYYIFHNTYVNIMTNLIGLFLITLLYEGRTLKRLVTVALIYMTNIVAEGIVFYSFSYYAGVTAIEESIYECITSMCILTIAALLERTMNLKNKTIQVSRVLWISLSLVPVVCICMVVAMVVSMPGSPAIAWQMTGLLFVNLIIFYIYDSLLESYGQKIETERMQREIEIYSNELQIMKESYYNVRMLKHDMKHHIIELKYLADKQQATEILAYVREMEKALVNAKEYAQSGNVEMDGTLNYFLQRAEQALISPKVHITLPENLSLHTYLVNVILGNLLENAIRAAEKSEEKYLFVDISFKQGVFCIKIENSYSGTINEKDGQLITSKNEDVQNHGLGLRSVQRMVEEVHGMLQIDYTENRFKIDVLLYQNSLEK